MRRAKILSVAAASAVALLVQRSARATDWLGTTDLSWNTPTNWSAGVPTAATVANFPVTLAAAPIVTLDGAQVAYALAQASPVAVTINPGTAGSLNLVSTETSGNPAINVTNTTAGAILTIGSTTPISLGASGAGAQTFTLSNTGGADFLTMTSGPTNLADNTGVTASVVFAGNQRIKLNGNNIGPMSYSGDTIIDNINTTGSYGLRISGSAAFSLPHGAGKGNVILNGRLEIQQGGSPLGSFVINGLSGAGNFLFNSVSGAPIVVGDGNANGSFSGFIGGTFAITKIGSGFQALTNTSTSSTTGLPYSGGVAALGGTLSVNLLNNYGTVGGLGSGTKFTNDGALRFDGGNLQYAGATAPVVDRLFTVGFEGGSLEASGSTGSSTSAVNFANTAAITVPDTAMANGRLPAISTTDTTVQLTSLNTTANLAAGMTVTGSNVPAGATITSVDSATAVTISFAAPASAVNAGFRNYIFGLGTSAAVIPRMFTLTGSNTGGNILAPQLIDSPTAPLTLNKSGTGNWLLLNTNTYTGGTRLSGGTLSVAANTRLGTSPVSPVANNLVLDGGTLRTGNELATITLTNPGTGFLTFPTVTVNGGADNVAARTTTVADVTGAKVNVAGVGYTSVPTITPSASQTGGTNMAVNAVMGVGAIPVTSGGTGYDVNPPTVTISGGGGAGATATATVVGGVITAINITNAGTGYTGSPTIMITGGNNDAVPGTSTLSLVGVTVVTPGTGYTASPSFAVTAAPAGGTNATVGLNGITLTNLQLSQAGFDYSSPTVSITGGSGTGATASATGTATTWALDTNRGISLTANGGGLDQTAGTTLTYAGVISSTGAGTFTKSGAGTLTLTAPETYTGNTAVTAGTLNIASTSSLPSGTNLTASGIVHFSNAAQTIGTLNGASTGALNVDAGSTLTVNGLGSYAGAVNAGGTVQFSGNTGVGAYSRSVGAVAVAAGGLVRVNASTFPYTPAVMTASGLSFAGPTAKFNLTNNELFITGTTLAAVVPQITAGNIMTTSAGGALGTLQVGPDVEVRFTLLGDTNLDGKVDVTDLGNLASNYGAPSGATWVQGDTNYSGAVDVTDLGNLASNYGGQLAAGPSAGEGGDLTATSLASVAGAGAAVPEPTSLGLLAVGATALLGRRRRAR